MLLRETDMVHVSLKNSEISSNVKHCNKDSLHDPRKPEENIKGCRIKAFPRPFVLVRVTGKLETLGHLS
jgi:hypothetical protein